MRDTVVASNTSPVRCARFLSSRLSLQRAAALAWPASSVRAPSPRRARRSAVAGTTRRQRFFRLTHRLLQRGGGEENAVDLVLRIAKLSLRLVNSATSKDAKGFVAVIKELKPVLFSWKDETTAMMHTTAYNFSKAELDEYGDACKAVESRLTALLQRAKALLAVSSNDNSEEIRRDTMQNAKALAEGIQRWKKSHQPLVDKAGYARPSPRSATVSGPDAAMAAVAASPSSATVQPTPKLRCPPPTHKLAHAHPLGAGASRL